MRKACFSGTDADACRWGRLPRLGVVASFAVCKLRRLDGRGTTVVPRQGLRPENFEWGLGTGKRKGQSRVTWTLEARFGNRLKKG